MGWMQGAGSRFNVPNGTSPYDPNWDAQYTSWVDELTRQNEAKHAAAVAAADEQRRREFMDKFINGGGAGGGVSGDGGGSYEEEIMKNVFGSPDYNGAPQMSGIPGYSYKTNGSAPRYHEEMPMGGAPGVWAIRNDEIAGPRGDRHFYRGMKRPRYLRPAWLGRR